MSVKITVDAKGLKCPMPLLKAKQALNNVDIGDIVEVLATDAASMQDIKAYADMSRHVLVMAEDDGTIFRYQLRKESF